MTSHERAMRLIIYVNGSHTYQGRPLGTEIVHRAHRAGLRGATSLHGIAGFGSSRKIHTTPRFGLVDHSPVAITIVDTPDRIRFFLTKLDDLADKCLVVCNEVELPHRHEPP